MSLDHDDADAVLRFSDDVDAALSEAASGFEPWTLRLIGLWVVAGALITLAVRSNGALSTILYILGFAVVAVWAAGFHLAKGDRDRWYSL